MNVWFKNKIYIWGENIFDFFVCTQLSFKQFKVIHAGNPSTHEPTDQPTNMLSNTWHFDRSNRLTVKL